MMYVKVPRSIDKWELFEVTDRLAWSAQVEFLDSASEDDLEEAFGGRYGNPDLSYVHLDGAGTTMLEGVPTFPVRIFTWEDPEDGLMMLVATATAPSYILNANGRTIEVLPAFAGPMH